LIKLLFNVLLLLQLQFRTAFSRSTVFGTELKFEELENVSEYKNIIRYQDLALVFFTYLIYLYFLLAS